MQMKTNKNGVKLLAAIMVFAMAFAGAFILIGSDDSDSAVTESNVAQIGTGNAAVGYDTLAAAIKEVTAEKNTITLLKDCEIGAETIDLSAKNTSITIDGGEKTKYDITLKGIVQITMASGKTITIQNADIVNTDASNNTTSYELQFFGAGSKVVLNNCEFTGNANVEYGMTLNETTVTGEFNNVDFNSKIVGTVDETNKMKVTNCQDLRINFAKKSTATYTLGTGGSLDIDSASASSTTLNFAANAASVVLTLDLNGGDYTFKNITERKHTSTNGAKLTITNGTLTNTTFGTYIGDLNDKAEDIERASYIFFGKDESGNGVTLAGKTVIGVGTDTADYTTVAGEVAFKDDKSYIEASKNAVLEDLKVISSNASSAGNAIFADIKAGDGKLTIRDGSIVIEGGIVTQTESKITVAGNAKLKSNIPSGLELEIKQGATVEIPSGSNVTLTGTIKFETGGTVGTIVNNGTLTIDCPITTNGNITNNATVNLKKEITPSIYNDKNGITYLAPGIIDNTDGNKAVVQGSEGQAFGMKEKLESDYTVLTNAYLQGKLIIPEGITLTIKGVLDLNGNELTVKGSLVIESKGSVINTKEGSGSIVLESTGKISNDGVIGNGYAVTVEDSITPSNKVILKNVVGTEFGLTEVVYTEGGEKKVKNILTVSGEITKKGDASSLTITGAYIGDLTIGEISSVSISGIITSDSTVVIGARTTISTLTVTMQNGATLSVDGKVTAGTITMTNGSTVVLNGKVGSGVVFQAKTGSFPTFKDGKRITAEEFTNTVDYTLNYSKISLTNLVGITIEISTKAFVGGVDGKTQMTEQMMNLSGTATYTKDTSGTEETPASLTVTGKVYVAQGETLALLGDKMSLLGANTSGDTIVTNGTLSLAIALDNVDGDKKVSNIGTEYSVKTPTATTPVTTYYYTTFDAAFSIIDTVEGKEVKINGDYEFDKDYTIAAGQTVKFTTATISKDSKITVQKDGTLSEEFKTNGIKGILVVMADGDCKPVDGSYEVKSADADENITYSGAEIAIANAQSGTTIYIVNQVKFEDKVTVPQGVTVDVATTAEILVENGLAVDGKILNKGTISMNKGDLDVAGEIDNKGTMNFNDATNKHKVNVAGSISTDEPFGTNSTINAATYENGIRTVYTTVASAMDAVSKMTLPVDITVTGKVSESSSITLVDGMKLVISGDVTLESIRIVTGSTLDIDDNEKTKLTADVIGAVGKADTTGAVSDATVGLSKVNNVDFTITYDESTTTYTMIASPVAAYAGSIIVKAGSVTIDTAATTEFRFQNGETVRTLSVSEGATLVVKNNVKFTDIDGKGFTNAGKIESKAGMTFTTATIGGEVVVAVGKTVTFVGDITPATTDKPAVFNPVTIAGTITLSEKEGKDPANASIDGPVFIGTAPTTLGATGTLSGKVNFEAHGFVIVFDGSTFSTTVEGVKSTAYMINGDAFAKIYGDAKIDVINPIVDDLKDLNVTCTKDSSDEYTVYNIVWMNGSTKITDSDAIGDFETVETTIGYNTVDVLISTAPGMLVYIDDFKVGTEEPLTIGEHTVTVYLQPDYTGTATITFNGQTITNGKIVITTDMLGVDQKLVVTGATPVEPSTPIIPVPTPTPSEKDDSMGITEYLLIVLVILAAILVVVVAIRMMRS